MGCLCGAKLITMDKAEGCNLEGIVYLRTVGEADDLVREIEVIHLQHITNCVIGEA